MTRITYADGSYETFMYDKVGNRTKVIDAEGNEMVYLYDSRDRLTKVIDPEGKATSYFYDKAGRRTRMIDPASDVVTYLYDDRGLLTKVQVGASTHGTYYYDDAGRRTRLLYGNSSYTSYLYDDADRLTLISHRKSDDTVISSFAYQVDRTGNRTKLTLDNGDYIEYLYDDTYQLTKEHRRDSGGATLYWNAFYYDAAGNRTRLEYNDGTSTTTTTYLYNEADQLTREVRGDTVTTYLYDANGNLTRKDDGTDVHSYAYDIRNLMTSYDGPGTANDATYAYDAQDRRIQKTVAGSTTKYYHDGLNVVAEYDGSDQLLRTYVTPGLDDNLSLTASGSTYYYLKDALGSIRQLIDASETVQNSYDYYAFGRIYGTPTENVTQPFRFTGRAWDSESQLYYYRARNYDAGLGRFGGRDLVGFVSNRGVERLNNEAVTKPYCYVLNSPLMLTDALGRKACPGADRREVDVLGDPSIALAALEEAGQLLMKIAARKGDILHSYRIVTVGYECKLVREKVHWPFLFVFPFRTRECHYKCVITKLMLKEYFLILFATDKPPEEFPVATDLTTRVDPKGIPVHLEYLEPCKPLSHPEEITYPPFLSEAARRGDFLLEPGAADPDAPSFEEIVKLDLQNAIAGERVIQGGFP